MSSSSRLTLQAPAVVALFFPKCALFLVAAYGDGYKILCHCSESPKTGGSQPTNQPTNQGCGIREPYCREAQVAAEAGACVSLRDLKPRRGSQIFLKVGARESAWS